VIASTMAEVSQEYQSARRRFPAFHSAHEGYGVLLEEVDELWTEIKSGGTQPQDRARMRQEAIQVAAMAVAFVMECCHE